jgi:hypothetical protein
MGELQPGDRVAIMAFDRLRISSRISPEILPSPNAISGKVLRRKNRCCSPIQSAVGVPPATF